jgi:hypothetical protein
LPSLSAPATKTDLVVARCAQGLNMRMDARPVAVPTMFGSPRNGGNI